MSQHVYVANQGLKDDPIACDAWLAAARQHPGLQLEELRNRKTGALSYAARRRDDPRERLHLDPYGLIHAQNPSRALIDIMFDLAAALGAGVYSERAKPYRSPEDWEKRTRKYREQSALRRAEHQQSRRRRIVLWTTYFVVVISAGIYALVKKFA